MASISVIVPVYRVEPYLRRCVDSILGQTFRDFELILVDDGSPDNCGAICQDYAGQDGRIHVLHRENGGLSAARNAGLDWAFAHSGSRYVAFVDSDDWVHPAFLQTLFAMAENTGCPVAVCGFFRTSGEPLPEGEDFSAQKLTAVAWNKLYDRKLFHNLRYPEGKLHEDEFTTYRAVYAAGTVAATPARLYAYYQNPQGIMRSAWNPRRMHILEALEGQIAFARQTGRERLLSKAAEQYIYSAYEHLEKVPPQYRPALRRKLRRGLKLGRACGCFPWDRSRLWAYEKAYPCKPVWYLASKLPAGKKERET